MRVKKNFEPAQRHAARDHAKTRSGPLEQAHALGVEQLAALELCLKDAR